MDLKIFLGIGAGVLLIGSFVPYFAGIIKGHTAPHSYTWLIWSITQTLAAVVIFEAGGGLFSALSVGSVAALSLLVFLASVTRGTEHIHVFDSIILVVALVATVLWWQLDNNLYSILLICFIDAIGFIPTYRKTFIDPHTESVFAWSLYLGGNVFALMALAQYSILTTSYLLTMITATALLLILILRRR